MWYWNPVSCNEALPGIHDLVDCIRIEDDAHPFKTQPLPEGKIWGNDENNKPVLQDIPAPTPDDLAAEAESRKAQLKALADSEIAWRKDAVEEGIATEEEAARLTEWKKYRVLLMRVDTSNPVWPDLPQQVGLREARFVTSRGRNANGQWIIWSDGAIEVMGYGVSIENGLATVTYPIELPDVSRYISIAERLSGDPGAASNYSHTSMVIDSLTTKAGFKARCTMAATGNPSSNGFSWRVYYAPV